MIPDDDMQKLKSLSRATRGGTLDPQRLAERAYRMGSDSITLPLNLEELERIALTRALELTHNMTAASRLLGIGKTTAYRKAKQYELT